LAELALAVGVFEWMAALDHTNAQPLFDSSHWSEDRWGVRSRGVGPLRPRKDTEKLINTRTRFRGGCMCLGVVPGEAVEQPAVRTDCGKLLELVARGHREASEHQVELSLCGLSDKRRAQPTTVDA